MQAKYPVSVSVVLSLTLLGGLVWGVQTTLAGNPSTRQPSLQAGTGKDKPGSKPTAPVTPTGPGGTPGNPSLSPQGSDPLGAPTTPTTGAPLDPMAPGSGGAPTTPGTGTGGSGMETTPPVTTPPSGTTPPPGGMLEPSPNPTSSPVTPK